VSRSTITLSRGVKYSMRDQIAAMQVIKCY